MQRAPSSGASQKADGAMMRRLLSRTLDAAAVFSAACIAFIALSISGEVMQASCWPSGGSSRIGIPASTFLSQCRLGPEEKGISLDIVVVRLAPAVSSGWQRTYFHRRCRNVVPLLSPRRTRTTPSRDTCHQVAGSAVVDRHCTHIRRHVPCRGRILRRAHPRPARQRLTWNGGPYSSFSSAASSAFC